VTKGSCQKKYRPCIIYEINRLQSVKWRHTKKIKEVDQKV